MIFTHLMIWLCVLCIVYTYLIYPLAAAIAAKLAPWPIKRARSNCSASIVIAARNEQRNIGRRVRELERLLERRQAPGEIIVVSDGSTDRTVAEARAAARAVRVIELPRNQGKAAALNAGVAAARYEIVVFADARQHWADDALDRLLENFADSRVGAATGDLVVESSPGVMAGVGLYWRYEKWIRQNESRVGCLAGATGSISAARRELFRPLPEGIVAEDIYWPLQIAMQGFGVIHDERAVAFDRLPPRGADEFQRKVRTLTGNFQLVARLPGALLPWRNRVWTTFVSHKLLRLAVPWALVALFAASVAVLDEPIYRAFFLAQIAFYALAVIGACPRTPRIAKTVAAFVLLNGAAWAAFWVWLLGASGKSWRPVHYPAKALAGASKPSPGSPPA